MERYALKAVIFDSSKEYKELKEDFLAAGITVLTLELPKELKNYEKGKTVSEKYFSIFQDNLQKLVAKRKLTLTECLLLTEKEWNAFVADKLGIVVVGCMEQFLEEKKVEESWNCWYHQETAAFFKVAVLLENPNEVSVNYLNQIYCHAKGIPAVIAETKRCFIRELTKDDAEDLYEILADQEVANYLPPLQSRQEELEKLSSYIEYVYPFFGYGYWGIFKRQTQKFSLQEKEKLIGKAGFLEGSSPLEVGYVIKRSEWGKGFATEVVKALVDYAAVELDCTELVAKIAKNNIASRRVAEKCGVTTILVS